MSNKKNNMSNNYSSEIYAKTKKYQKIYGFEIGKGKHDAWNNEADAFKHTFAAADTALKSNAGISKLLGDKHESDGRNKMGQSSGEENMDKWNNAEGRKIAQKIAKDIGSIAAVKSKAWRGELDDIIAKEVMQKMKKGELVTHPNDSRKYKDTKSASQKLSDDIKNRYHQMQEERKRKYPIFKNNNSSSKSSSKNGSGRWVTINGNHVYID